MVLDQFTVEFLGRLDELLGLAIASVALTATRRWRSRLDGVPARVVIATAGTLCIAYGVREFLRATDGGYYCCDHGFFQAIGIGLTAIGWAILLIGLAPVLGGRSDF